MSKKHRKKPRRNPGPPTLPRWMHCERDTDSLEIRFVNGYVEAGLGLVAFSFFWLLFAFRWFGGVPRDWEIVIAGLVPLAVGLALLGGGLSYLLQREIIRVDESGLTWRRFVILPIRRRHIAWDDLFALHAKAYCDSWLRRDFWKIRIETGTRQFCIAFRISQGDCTALMHVLNDFIDDYRQRHGLRPPLEDAAATRNVERKIERLQLRQTAGRLEISGNPQYSGKVRAFLVVWFSAWMLCFGVLFFNSAGQTEWNAKTVYAAALYVTFFCVICLFTAWLVFLFFRHETFQLDADGLHYRLELRLFLQPLSLTIKRMHVPLSDLYKAETYALTLETGIEFPIAGKPLRCFRLIQTFGDHRQLVRAVNATLKQLGVDREVNRRQYDPLALPGKAIGRWRHEEAGNSHTLSRRGRTTWYNRVAILAIFAFWNGGVSVFVIIVVKGFLIGENLTLVWGLAVFLIPFVAVGLMILFYTVAAWSIFLFRWRIDISPDCVRSRLTIFGLGPRRRWPCEEIVRAVVIRRRKANNIFDTIRNPEIAAGNGYDNVYPCAVRMIGPNSDPLKVKSRELIRDLSEHEAGCIADLIRGMRSPTANRVTG